MESSNKEVHLYMCGITKACQQAGNWADEIERKIISQAITFFTAVEFENYVKGSLASF